jgi:hypothetical protein
MLDVQALNDRAMALLLQVRGSSLGSLRALALLPARNNG